MRLILAIKNRLLKIRLLTRITLCIISVILIPVAVFYVVYSETIYNMVIADTIRNEQKVSAQMVPQLKGCVDEIVECMDDIMGQEYYSLWFNSPDIKDIEALSSSDAAFEYADYTKSLIENSPISNIKIYMGLPAGNSLYSSKSAKDLFVPEELVMSTYWHGIFNGKPYVNLLCPAFYLSGREISEYGDLAYIQKASFCYKGNVYPAYIAIYYSSDLYAEVLNNENLTTGSVSYIINDRDATIVTTDSALSGTYRVRYKDAHDSLMSSNSFVERQVAGTDVFTGFYSIDSTNWFLVNVIPKQTLIGIANKMLKDMLSVCFVCIAIAIIIAFAIARSITRRIAAVSDQMAKVHNGPPVAMLPSKLKDEVGELIDTYNYMTQEMNRLIEEREETAKELRYAEFNALQAQINPHFLYNTMDMINWMAISGRNREVSEVVQALSKFYKLTLSRKKEYSTVADEVEHASVYVDLQNRRFDNAITFVVDVPDELCRYRLPKLTLQPILENAILHGILEKDEKEGTIVLTAWQEDEDLVILVSDDGAGMSDDEKNNILSDERITPVGTRGSKVAIVNIHRRLQLLYGEKYGLSYESELGRGCDVTIRLPKHVGEESYIKK